MGKKHFNLATGMHLEDAPLVYLHEHFKKLNNKKLENNWVWFDKKILVDILTDIQGLKGGDGVRLYYGVYNNRVCEYLTEFCKNDPKTARDYSDHEGHNTVFFVPTYKGAVDNEHIDNISSASIAKIRKDYNSDLEIPIPHPITGGFDVGNICPPPTIPGGDCSKSGSNL